MRQKDANDAAYWETTALEDMTPAQWEGLCDGCGRCCLLKLEDVDQPENSAERFLYSAVACQLLDCKTGSCSDYADRLKTVPDCVVLDVPTLRAQKHWMPETCAYRRLAEGRPLPSWHPLISGSRRSVHEAGYSIAGWAISETDFGEEEDLVHYIIEPFHLLPTST